MANRLALSIEHTHTIKLLWFTLWRAIAAPTTPEITGLIALNAIERAIRSRLDMLVAITQRAVFINRVRPDQTIRLGATFNDVQGLFIWRETQTIRPGEIFDHARDFGVWGEI